MISFSELMDNYEQEILQKLLKKADTSPDMSDQDFVIACDHLLKITDDEIIKNFNSYFGLLSKGNLQSESLRNSMYLLYVKMRRKRKNSKLNHHTKSALDKHIYKILRLIFFQMYEIVSLAGQPTHQELNLMRNVAFMIYDMVADSDDGTAVSQEKLDAFIEELKNSLYKEYPHFKQKKVSMTPAKKLILKNKEELALEAKTVMEMLGTAGPFMPEKAGITYHVITMEWFMSWKQYVGIQNNEEETKEASIKQEEQTQEMRHPGRINSEPQLDKIKVGSEVAMLSHDQLDNIQIKTSCKLDEDFIVVNDQTWNYLFEIYDGRDIPRYSIEVATENNTEETDKEYIIELYYKRLQVYILPREAEHLFLRKPSSIYISRKATVFDYHKKVAEILLPNQNKRSLEDLLGISRLWRLETGEDVLEIERYYPSDNKNGIYVIRGKVLGLQEVIEDIDVAEDDCLLYEVKLNYSQLEKNGYYAFVPRQ